MSDDTRVLLAVVTAGVLVIGLTIPSVMYMERVLAPMFGAVGLDILTLISIVLILGGGGYAWYKIYIWTYVKLGGRE